MVGRGGGKLLPLMRLTERLKYLRIGDGGFRLVLASWRVGLRLLQRHYLGKRSSGCEGKGDASISKPARWDSVPGCKEEGSPRQTGVVAVGARRDGVWIGGKGRCH